MILRADELERHDADGSRAAGTRLDRLGARYRNAGIELGYHNHVLEMAEMEGKRALDWLFSETHPDNLFLEADLGWIYAGGHDPAQVIRDYAGRVRQLHLRDMDRSARYFPSADISAQPVDQAAIIETIRSRMQFNRRLGEGCFDWDGIVRAASDSGVEWMLNEADADADPIAALAHSYQFMARLVV